MTICHQCEGSGQVQGRTEVKDKHTGKIKGGHGGGGGGGASGAATSACQQCLGKGYY